MTEQNPNVIKLFVRHGKSVNNARVETGDPLLNRVGGYQPNVELAREGMSQAFNFGRVALHNLSEMLDRPVRLVRLGAGPSVRTRETARYIREGLQNPSMPITNMPHMREQCKGNKWLGGDEKRLRSSVETAAYLERRAAEGWDFRSGRPWVNRLGLHVLHGAETPREVGARILPWFTEVPPLADRDRNSDVVLVDMVVSHGLAGLCGMARLLHTSPDSPSDIGISVNEAYEQYHLANATAFVVSQDDAGGWTNHGRITP